VALQLSGHTHGGQLLPLGWLARLFAPRVAGLARFGKTWLYVSEGTGYWGPPMRVGTTQEITAITLRHQDSPNGRASTSNDQADRG
jgi:predicted MPP superfamily phosphohydrolase